MLPTALRYPLQTPDGRDAFAICTGLVIVTLLLIRVATGLWPAWVAVVPGALSVGPVILVAGYLGSILSNDSDEPTPPPFQWSVTTLQAGVRTLVVGGAYLLPPVVILFGTVFVLLEAGGSPAGSPLLAVAPTIALFALIGFTYVLPAAVVAGLQRGVRAGLSRDAIGGLVSGGYFFAWTVAASVLVVAWSVIGAVGVRSPLAVIGAVMGTYGTLVAAKLLADGLQRSRWRPPT